MTDPDPLDPWTSAPAEQDRRAAALAKVVAGLPPRAVHAGDWEDVLLRAAQPRSPLSSVLIFAASTLVALTVGLAWQRGAPAPLERPSFTASREAKVVVDADGARLSLGKLEIAARNATRLVTPHVSVMVTGKVAAEVDAFSTRIDVYEGVAQVRAGTEITSLQAGEGQRWPTVPELPRALAGAPPPSTTTSEACDERPEAQRLACLVEESRGEGLTAQVALYQRAAWQQTHGHPRAAEPLWRESLVRFPDGALAPEVRLALLRRQLEGRRVKEALDEARDFERHCPDDPRLDELRRLRRALEAHP